MQKKFHNCWKTTIFAEQLTKETKTGRKIRDAEINKLPFMLIVGENEELNGTISVRRRGEGDLGEMSVEDFITYFKKKQKLVQLVFKQLTSEKPQHRNLTTEVEVHKERVQEDLHQINQKIQKQRSSFGR